MTDEVVEQQENVEQTSTEAAPAVNEVEQRARAQGWLPKEEWQGDPTQWRDAAQYLDRGELLGKIKSQSSELRELKAMIGYVSEQNKKLYETGYQRAIADLQLQRDKAIDDGDHRAVRELDRAIKDHEKALEDTRNNASVAVDPRTAAIQAEERFNEFKAGNSWYVENDVMQNWANGAAVRYKAEHPRASDTEIYEFLAKEVRNKFPNEFKQKVGAPSPDGKGSRGAGSPARSGASEFDALMAELPEAEAQIAYNLVKRGHVTKEQFIKSYKQLGGRR